MSKAPVTALVPVRRNEKIVRTVPGEVVPYVKPKKATPKYKNYQWRNEVWYLRIWIEGHLLYKSTGYSDITSAKRKGEQIIREYKEARDKLGVFGKQKTLAQWWEEYRTSHSAAKRCGHHDVLAMTPFVEAHGSLRLNQFTKEICQTWINQRGRMLSAHGQIYKPNTIRLEIAKIKAVFRAAMPRYLVWNPMTGTRMPDPTQRLRVLEGDEQTRFLHTLDDETCRLVQVLLGCGLRRRELLGNLRQGLAGLRACDVTERTVYVRKEVAKRGKARTVDIQAWVYQVLDRQREIRGVPWGSTEPLFAIFQNTANRRMQRASERLGLTGEDVVTLHDLRRTFITSCLRAGVNTKLVAEQVGHTSTRIIDVYYNALNRQDLRAAMAKVQFGPVADMSPNR